LIYFYKSKQRFFSLIAFYSFYCIFSDLVLSKLSLKYLESELYSFRLFTIVEYSIITFFIFQLIESDLFKKLIKIGSTIFIIVSILDIYTSSFTSFDSLPSGLESILILSYCLFFVYEKMTSTDFSFNGTIWITIGFILFFSGTFFLFILSQNNFKDSSFILTYGYIVAIFNIIKNLFITIGIISESNNSKRTSHKLQKA
jgi:hypothetical protein